MIPTRRLKILYYGIFKNTNHIPLREVFYHAFRPISSLLSRLIYISAIKKEDNNLKIEFHGIDKSLYYPSDMSIGSMHQVAVESFDLNDWHYYEKDGTPIRQDDIVVDCGAAEGLFSLKNIDRCKRLYVVEPLPKFISCLEKTFKDVNNVTIIPEAFTDNIGTAAISDYDISSFICSGKGTSIKTATLDSYFFDKNRPLTFLKADLEGSEMQMLEGAQKSIAKYKPKIAITTYHKQGDFTRISAFLKRVNPDYNFKFTGIHCLNGEPVMLHAFSGEYKQQANSH